MVTTRSVTAGSADWGSGRLILIIIDLEHDRRAVKIERPKIMLAMWIVRGAEIVKRRDGLNQSFDSLSSEGGNTDAGSILSWKYLICAVLPRCYPLRNPSVSVMESPSRYLGLCS
jgi:hypothetical protein